MGDYTWGELTVLDLDTEKYPDEAAAIIALIDEAGLEYQWDHPDEVDPLTTLQVGHRCQYADDQVSCGFAEYLDGLAEEAPHALFRGYEAQYEWLGETVIRVPGLGVWRQTCDNNGDPVFYTGEVKAFVEAASRPVHPGRLATVQALLAKAASTESPAEAISLRAKARKLMPPVDLALGTAWHAAIAAPVEIEAEAS